MQHRKQGNRTHAFSAHDVVGFADETARTIAATQDAFHSRDPALAFALERTIAPSTHCGAVEHDVHKSIRLFVRLHKHQLGLVDRSNPSRPPVT
ncbi:hypothetical protein Q5752_005882 [Cryptotrichosporon argae]